MIEMCENPELGLETSEANKKLDTLDQRVDKTQESIIATTKATEEATEKSFKQVRGMMRASYMMVSGLTQVIGGPFGAIFGSMFGIAISAIGVWEGIATAMKASGVGLAQGIIMSASLITSLMSLLTGLAGQTELAGQISGLTLTLQGFGGMLDAMPFG